MLYDATVKVALSVLLLAVNAWAAAIPSLSSAMKKAGASGTMRIAWMGTSITCGLGASSEGQRFTTLVNKLFERQTGAKIVARNFCFGGAHSLLQVALLKTSVVPWKPDLVIAELGTLDELYKSVSLPSIESFVRIVSGAGIPLIVLYPYTTYAEVARDGLHRLGALYGFDVIDMATYASKRGVPMSQISMDGCHPNDRGQALIADAFQELLKSDAVAGVPPKPIYAPDLSGLHFQAIQDDAGEHVAPRLYDGQGFALKVPAGRVITQKFRGSLIGLLFRFAGTPRKLSYKLDDGGWIDVQIAPEWFLNYLLRSDLPDTAHIIQVRMEPKPGKPAMLEGFLVN